MQEENKIKLSVEILEKKCTLCGNEFRGRLSAKYCSDECKKKAKKAQDKLAGRKYRESLKIKK